MTVPTDKVLWLQPHFTDPAGEPVFVQGVAKEVDPLPDARPVTLTFQPLKGTAKVVLKTTNHLAFHTPAGGSGRQQFEVEARLTESGDAAAADRGTLTHLAVQEGDKIDAILTTDGKVMPRHPSWIAP